MWLLYQHYPHQNHLGGRALKNTYFPQAHFRHMECVLNVYKILQGEAG